MSNRIFFSPWPNMPIIKSITKVSNKRECHSSPDLTLKKWTGMNTIL